MSPLHCRYHVLIISEKESVYFKAASGERKGRVSSFDAANKNYVAIRRLAF